jgi:hypothetical protein
VSENSVHVSCSSSSLVLVLEIPRKTEDEGRRRARGNHAFFRHALNPKSEVKARMNTNRPSAAQPPPEQSAGLPTRSRCEGKTVWASPQALAWGEPLRLGTAALRGLRKLRLGTAALRCLRKVCAARQNLRDSSTNAQGVGFGVARLGTSRPEFVAYRTPPGLFRSSGSKPLRLC